MLNNFFYLPYCRKCTQLRLLLFLSSTVFRSSPLEGHERSFDRFCRHVLRNLPGKWSRPSLCKKDEIQKDEKKYEIAHRNKQKLFNALPILPFCLGDLGRLGGGGGRVDHGGPRSDYGEWQLPNGADRDRRSP
jgi:hypothetical protein